MDGDSFVTRILRMNYAAGLFLFLYCLVTTSLTAAENESPVAQPNILWISAEDISAGTLGCYGGDSYTPTIDALAAVGIRYDAAFAAAPVCAPSRSAIITGCMPTTLGSLPMRCKASPPSFLIGFPKLLRDAGYWCSNNAKTDYNLNPSFDAGWNASGNAAHWRKRDRPTRPFFSVFNLAQTHESGLFRSPAEWKKLQKQLPKKALRDPETLAVPAYYPDTLAVRADLAHRMELASLLDIECSRILSELTEDGLRDNTIIFFWGDHGEGLPHGKRSLTEHGLRVPLIVHLPKAIQKAIHSQSPEINSRLVSLLDLGPTALDLAGVPIPLWMEGKSFLGSHTILQSEIISARDRMDEREGFSRSVRTDRYRYVRHFLPWVSGDDLPNYASGVAITRELRTCLREGTLPAGASWFSRSRRPPEELFDIDNDPEELNDVHARRDHSSYATALSHHRAQLVSFMRSSRDTGILPEAMLRREALLAGSEWGVFHPATQGSSENLADRQALARYDEILKVAMAVAEDHPPDYFASELKATDPAVRYWAACGVGWSGIRIGADSQKAAALFLEPLLIDSDAVVRIAAARWFSSCTHTDQGLDVLLAIIGSDDPSTRMAALIAVESLGERAARLRPNVASLSLSKIEEYSDRLKARITGKSELPSHVNLDATHGKNTKPNAQQ